MHSHDWLLLGIGKWTQHRDGISILPVRFDFLIILFVYFRLSWVLVAVPLFPCYSERVILFIVEPGLLTAAASLSWSTSSRRLGFQLPGSRTQAQWLWYPGLLAPQHVGSSQIRDGTWVSCTGRHSLYHYQGKYHYQRSSSNVCFCFYFFFKLEHA